MNENLRGGQSSTPISTPTSAPIATVYDPNLFTAAPTASSLSAAPEVPVAATEVLINSLGGSSPTPPTPPTSGSSPTPPTPPTSGSSPTPPTSPTSPISHNNGCDSSSSSSDSSDSNDCSRALPGARPNTALTSAMGTATVALVAGASIASVARNVFGGQRPIKRGI